MPRKATVRARGLGTELRELRQQTGIPMTQVGERMGWSVATISRIENGQRGVTTEEVSALLMIYGVAPEERDRMISLAREAGQPGWWETRATNLPKQLTALIGFEAQATRITDMRLSYLPGLLQTPDYARELMHLAGYTGQAAEPRIAMRMGRQAILTKENAPHYRAFVDEGVLQRPLASPTVMADQLIHIVTTAQRTNVTIQVLPFSCGGHRGLSGSFMILEFEKARTIVHLENRTSGLFLDEPNDTDIYLHDAASLEKTALTPAASLKLLSAIAQTYTEE